MQYCWLLSSQMILCIICAYMVYLQLHQQCKSSVSKLASNTAYHPAILHLSEGDLNFGKILSPKSPICSEDIPQLNYLWLQSWIVPTFSMIELSMHVSRLLLHFHIFTYIFCGSQKPLCINHMNHQNFP